MCKVDCLSYSHPYVRGEIVYNIKANLEAADHAKFQGVNTMMWKEKTVLTSADKKYKQKLLFVSEMVKLKMKKKKMKHSAWSLLF